MNRTQKYILKLCTRLTIEKQRNEQKTVIDLILSVLHDFFISFCFYVNVEIDRTVYTST